MEVMVAVQSGTLLHALRVQLKRRVSTRRGGDFSPATGCTDLHIYCITAFDFSVLYNKIQH